MKSEEADAIEFETPHLKSVKQTVRTNVTYYKNVVQFIEDETDERYLKLYRSIQGRLDSYFAQVAEDILTDVYGEKYRDFFEKSSAEFAERAKRNAPNKETK